MRTSFFIWFYETVPWTIKRALSWAMITKEWISLQLEFWGKELHLHQGYDFPSEMLHMLFQKIFWLAQIVEKKRRESTKEFSTTVDILIYPEGRILQSRMLLSPASAAVCSKSWPQAVPISFLGYRLWPSWLPYRKVLNNVTGNLRDFLTFQRIPSQL